MKEQNETGLLSSLTSIPSRLIDQYTVSMNKDSIEYWQSVMFYNFAMIITLITIFLYIPGAMFAYSLGNFFAIILYTATYCIMTFVLFYKKLSITLKTIIISFILYMLGVIVFYYFGPAGDGRFWLFAYVILCSLFIGIRASILASLLNFSTDVIFGLLYLKGIIDWKNLHNYSFSNWILVSSNVLLISIIFSSGIALLIRGIIRSFKKINKTNEVLDATNRELTTAYESLHESNQRIYTISNNIKSGMIYQLTVAKDGSRKFTYLSDSVNILHGITPEEGMADPDLIYSKVHKDDVKKLKEAEIYSFQNFSIFRMELRFNTSAGIRWSSMVSIPRIINDGSISYEGIEFDITDIKNAEDKIKNLLAEKELLLREVHHRIKNNMNTIKGLLSLQISAEENPSALSSLQDAESRVQSIIMLYDRLNCSENYRELPIKDYLNSLAQETIFSFPNRGIVKIETDIEDFIINIQTLTALGIIANELITNIMKYAFAGIDDGVIKISAAMNNCRVVFIIHDNGVGIPESVSFENSTGFGLSLVGMLTEQIGGSIRIQRENGTKFILEFNI